MKSLGHIVDDLQYLDQVIARKDFAEYVKYVTPSLQFTDFHLTYYRILNLFAQGKIKKLIVSVPPQHGKSLGSSQLLPSYLLGIDPDLKIAIASYSATLATRFNKRIQRILKDASYNDVFPDTRLKDNSKGNKDANTHTQTSTEFEVVGRIGSVMAVGREGSLTGNQVDVFILDDLYKDAMEANSPVVRANCWEWYTSVVKTRMHNDSSELIVFTRWHEDDLIGEILNKEKHITLESFSDLEGLDSDAYVVVNFEAIKESPPTEIDPRNINAPLWPDRHGLKLLENKRRLDAHSFNCLYQGQPSSKEGLLYGDNFHTYSELPDTIKKSNYTDTADTGEDKLCSICYEVGKDGLIYITDILYTPESMEITEPAVAHMLIRNNTRIAYVESNNGGRGFARAVGKLSPVAKIEWFHQSSNKESRILTNAATVMKHIVLPADWRLRWGQFHNDVITYKRAFKSNRWDDAPDVLTGIVEKEVSKPKIRPINKQRIADLMR